MNKHISWEELGGSWHQKIYYNDNLEPIYTYHYGSKIKPSEKILILKTHKAEKACSYKLIEKDLRDILTLLKECEEIHSRHELTFCPKKTPKDGIILKGLLSAIVVHYFRCFPGSQGRKYKLQQQIISDKNLDTHKLLDEMRNKYIAHADKSIYENSSLVFLIPPFKRIRRGKTGIAMQSFELHQIMGGPDLITMVRDLVEELHKYITDEIDKVIHQIKDELQLIPEIKLYNFMNKKSGGRIELTQANLDTLSK